MRAVRIVVSPLKVSRRPLSPLWTRSDAFGHGGRGVIRHDVPWTFLRPAFDAFGRGELPIAGDRPICDPFYPPLRVTVRSPSPSLRHVRTRKETHSRSLDVRRWSLLPAFYAFSWGELTTPGNRLVRCYGLISCGISPFSTRLGTGKNCTVGHSRLGQLKYGVRPFSPRLTRSARVNYRPSVIGSDAITYSSSAKFPRFKFVSQPLATWPTEVRRWSLLPASDAFGRGKRSILGDRLTRNQKIKKISF